MDNCHGNRTGLGFLRLLFGKRSLSICDRLMSGCSGRTGPFPALTTVTLLVYMGKYAYATVGAMYNAKSVISLLHLL